MKINGVYIFFLGVLLCIFPFSDVIGMSVPSEAFIVGREDVVYGGGVSSQVREEGIEMMIFACVIMVTHPLFKRLYNLDRVGSEDILGAACAFFIVGSVMFFAGRARDNESNDGEVYVSAYASHSVEE